MGALVQVDVSVIINNNTPKAIQKLICKTFRDVCIDVDEFKPYSEGGYYLHFNESFGFSYSGLDTVENLKLPKKVNKHIQKAEMKITYIEQAPSQDFDLIDDEEEEED